MTETKPHRVQLSRKRGWRKPENTVVVARPSKWGNPFSAHDIAKTWRRCAEDPELDHRIGIEEGRRLAVVDFQHDRHEYGYPTDSEVRAELAGKNLACWCPLDGQPCHADVLLEIANED